MTNRRPDIHCNGCGTYCYSLSHLPWKQEFPASHYCNDCKKAIERDMRTGSMLNRQWYTMMHIFIAQLQKVRKLSEADIGKIGSFRLTMSSCVSPDERPISGKNPNKMTVIEWREISEQKLAYYRKYCNKEELALLNELIKTAH